MHKEAYLVKDLADGAVQCRTCEHFCAVKPGEKGTCGVRHNQKGTLYLTVYGEAVALHVDPIEKKPLFHFLPRSDALSIGTFGCNYRCPFCQNWQLSQPRDANRRPGRRGRELLPAAIVDMCLRDQIPIIAYTYNEPTVFFEYTLDTAKLAHEQDIKNVYVSNGYMSRAALDEIQPYLDGINVDLKAFDETFYYDHCQARLEPVKRNIAYLVRQTDVWVEVTTLLIPGLNDSPEELTRMARWLAETDPEIPWHVTAFHPDHHMLDRPPTPIHALAQAYEIGKQAGLQYVYVGNVMNTDRESTHCPQCGQLLIQRQWYTVIETWPERGICPNCNHPIAGRWS